MAIETQLGKWQSRLAARFSEIRDRRQSHNGGSPIFGLEHGLATADIQELDEAVRAHILNGPPSNEHSLAWIVYSSELGYRYSGEEYWQTFEYETPGWTQHGNRHRLKDFYLRFQKEYGGATPSGTWAEHFSIICWPITHAILPKDLQRHLAHSLFELRYAFDEEVLNSTSSLGSLISTRALSGSSRFQNFLQSKDLVGQISSALLLQSDSDTQGLIHPDTLKRISDDLERESGARTWLHRARGSARTRFRIRGTRRPRSNRDPHDFSRVDVAREEVANLGIEPRLILGPADSHEEWDVFLDIPALSNLCSRFPETREVIAESRCRVTGSAFGRPLAKGHFLYGVKPFKLSSWPKGNEVLLRFEKTNPLLNHLLRTECLIRPGPIWLFRIAPDGKAYECRSMRVKPGEQYVLISTDRDIESGNHSASIRVSCDGVYGTRLSIPPAVSSEWQEVLGSLGLEHKKTIEVWPAGLGAVAWDGDSHVGWPASETLCLGVLSDHPLETLTVSADNDPELFLELTSLQPGEPTFIEFPQFPVGRHHLKFSASSDLEEQDESEYLDVAIDVVEESLGQPNSKSISPLSIQMDPPNPSLEELGDGRAALSVVGPVGRNLNCQIWLYEREGDVATLTKELPSVEMPVSPEEWHAHFSHHFLEHGDVRVVYDTSRICILTFSAEELGAFSIRCDREFTPVRWISHAGDQSRYLQLQDDTDLQGNLDVSYSSFQYPCNEENLEMATRFEAPIAGGMYIARKGTFTSAMVVPPIFSGHDLAELGFEPHVRQQRRSLYSIVRLIEVAGLWGQAKLSGGLLSGFRKQKILLSLTSEISRLLCGDDWTRIEKEYNNSGHNTEEERTALRKLIWKLPPTVAIGLSNSVGTSFFTKESCNAYVGHLAILAARGYLFGQVTMPDGIYQSGAERLASHGTDDPIWLTEFALRVTSDASTITGWAGEYVNAGISRLLWKHQLVRTARLFVILSDRSLESKAKPGELYANWDWAS